MNNCITAGLGITINIHSGNSYTDSLLAASPAYADKVAIYWKSLASFFKKYSTDKIYFEVYNEPYASSGGLTTQGYNWWQNVQQKIYRV